MSISEFHKVLFCILIFHIKIDRKICEKEKKFITLQPIDEVVNKGGI